MSPEPEQNTVVVLYGLQTCSHCKSVRKLLQRRQARFRTVFVDMLIGNERSDTLRELKRINPALTFPTLKVGEWVIVGFKADDIVKALDSLKNEDR